MKKLFGVLLVVALFGFLPKSGFAFSLYGDYIGPLEFHFQAWDDGTTYIPQVDGSGNWTGMWIPSDSGAAVADNTYGVADGDVDSYGIGTVTSITKVPTGSLWAPPLDGSETLDIHLYGLDDDFVQGSFDTSGNPTGFSVETIGSTTTGGAFLDVYLGPGPTTFDPTNANKTLGIASVTDGTPFLRLKFVPVGPNGTVYSTSYSANLVGHGDGYLEVVTGWGDPAWEAVFDSDAYDSVYTGADFYLYNDYNTVGATPWLVKAQDPVTGAAIPEPATMVLMGIGLAGAALRRKRMG